jgi:hypothetical protein
MKTTQKASAGYVPGRAAFVDIDKALEINLKMLVCEGSNVLSAPTGPISLSTNALAPLAGKGRVGERFQMWAASIGWTRPKFDPVSRAIRYSGTGDPHSVSKWLVSLLDLVDSTADALAAE